MLRIFEHDILSWVYLKLAEALTIGLFSFFFLKLNQLLEAAVSKNFIRFWFRRSYERFWLGRSFIFRRVLFGVTFPFKLS